MNKRQRKKYEKKLEYEEFKKIVCELIFDLPPVNINIKPDEIGKLNPIKYT